MRARILPGSVVTERLVDTETGAIGAEEKWMGKAQFSDGRTYDFFWFKPCNRLLLVTDVEPHTRFNLGDPYKGVDEHSRFLNAKGERRKALLSVLYEYEIYWAPLEPSSRLKRKRR